MTGATIALKIDERMRDNLKLWAKLEGRSMSSYVEVLLLREEERRSGKAVTLETLREDVSDVREALRDLDEEVMAMRLRKASVRAVKRSDDLSAVLALPLPETLPSDVWGEWVMYSCKKGNRLSVEVAEKLLARWAMAESVGRDLGDLVEVAMQRGYRDAVFDGHLEPKSGNLEWWKEAK